MPDHRSCRNALPSRPSASRIAVRVRSEVGLARLAIGVVALHVVDDNFLQPNPGTSAGRPPPRRPHPARPPRYRRRVLRPSSRRRARDRRPPRRLLRHPRRHRGGALLASGRPLGRRLHGSPVDPRRVHASRSRRRHALDVAAARRPALVALFAAPAPGCSALSSSPSPSSSRSRSHTSSPTPPAPTFPPPTSAPRTRRCSSRRATDCGSAAGTSRRATAPR